MRVQVVACLLALVGLLEVASPASAQSLLNQLLGSRARPVAEAEQSYTMPSGRLQRGPAAAQPSQTIRNYFADDGGPSPEKVPSPVAAPRRSTATDDQSLYTPGRTASPTPIEATTVNPYGTKPLRRTAIAPVARDEEEAERPQPVAATDEDQPLHQRMSSLRRSAFDGQSLTAVPAKPAESAPAKTISRAAKPTLADAELDEPPLAAPVVKQPAVLQSPATMKPPVVKRSIASTPTIAPARAAPSAANTTRPAAIVAAPSKPAPAAPAIVAPAGNLLAQRQSPNLACETSGPRRITVGKESSYEVVIRNSAAVAAEELVVIVDLPASADVVGAEASTGSAQLVAGAAGGRQLRWRIGRLDGNAYQRLVVRIVPRESKPFELAVRWDYLEPSAQAQIEVQQPKLAVSVEGAREVLFGRKEVYRMKLANVGNGDAENVVIKLFPVGNTNAPASEHNFGTLAAGAEKAVEVELVARQSGNVAIRVEARCDGGIQAEATTPVLVRRGELRIEAAGPKFVYVEATGLYRVRAVNSGNAAAESASVAIMLPAGTKLVGSSESVKPEADGRILRWNLETLAPGAEKLLELKLTNSQPGQCRLDVVATAADDLTAKTDWQTRVEAVADLFMEVVDPQGPVALGEDATYEVRLVNRGTQAADEIDVAGFFSQGVEPVAADGSPHTISPGQVTFNTIGTLGPGKEVRLKIVAKAQAAGSHIFRAEVHCRPLGTRLVSEETTRFYASDDATEIAGSAGTLRTATRPNLLSTPADRGAGQLPPSPRWRQ